MGVETLDIVGPEAVRDPQAYFGRLREESPIMWNKAHRSWVVTSHRHVSALLRDSRLSSDRIRPFIESKLQGPDTDPLLRQAFEILAGWLVFQDDPGHARLRVLVNKGFTIKSVQAVRDRCIQLCDELLAKAPNEGEFDLLQAVIAPIPSVIIAEMLGVPVADRERFESWTRMVAPLVSGAFDDPKRYDSVAEGMDALVKYFKGLMDQYKRNPAENLISDLMQAREKDDSLSETELIATLVLILFGGHETTANLIANSIVALLKNPSQWKLILDNKIEPSAAIEELLRYDGPAKAVTRVIAETFTYEGHTFKAGERIFLVLSAANRDPSVFEQPDDLILGRPDARRHVGFGFGGHFCMGAPLARLEATIAIPKIIRRYPNMRLTSRELDWMPVMLTRGQNSLWVSVS